MRICDYTGEEFPGMGIIVLTTEGQKVMSPYGYGLFITGCTQLGETDEPAPVYTAPAAAPETDETTPAAAPATDPTTVLAQ